MVCIFFCAHYSALSRAYSTTYQLSEYFFHRSFLPGSFTSPEACTKLLFPLQSLGDCVKVKHKLSKDVGEPPPWGYPQETPPPPHSPQPPSPLRAPGFHRTRCVLMEPSETAARQLCAASSPRHDYTIYPNFLSVCLREREPYNKSTADPIERLLDPI